MKLYSAYIKRNKRNKIDDLILVKEGFSFWALIFGPIWFIYHKMYNEFIALAALNLIISQSSFIFNFSDRVLLELVVVFLVAINANYWYGLKLQKNGFKLVNIIHAKNKDLALFSFIDNYRTTIFRDPRSFDNKLLDPKFADYFSYKVMRFFKRSYTKRSKKVKLA